MPPRYLIIVEAPPERGSVQRDVRQRIGQWLKIGLRGFGLRAVDVREVQDRQTTGDEAGTNPRQT